MATIVVISIAAVGADGGDNKVIKILSTDIPDRLEIIGHLGHPLGTLIDVRGQWRRPERRVKDHSLVFRVLAINGRPPDASIEFRLARMVQFNRLSELTAKEGQVWEARVIESGAFHGLPPAAYRELYGDSSKDVPVQEPHGQGFRFETELRLLSCKLVRAGS
ncbi:MAG TPA: hypothetical protein VF306_19795 [Pirellulales bacterium]